MPPEQPAAQRQAFVPKIGESGPSVDNTDALYRELLLVMRIKLNSDQMFFDSITIINKVIQNILKNPGEIKYSKLRLSNEKIMKHIYSIEEACFLMEMIGFENIELPSGDNFDGPVENYFVLDEGKSDPRDLNALSAIITDVMTRKSLKPLTGKLNLDPKLKQQLQDQE